MDVDGVVAALREEGYVVLEGLLSPAEVAAARAELAALLEATDFGANSFVGRRTKRVFGLPAKTRALDGAVAHPLVLGALEDVLGEHLLSSMVAVEIHPGETAQTLHTDGSAWPVPPGGGEIVVNAIWALDDFTVANGATRLVPAGRADAESVVATMPAGSVLVYVGSLLHGGGANESASTRLGIVIGYTVAWLRQQENYVLTCPPDVARALPPALQGLLGYRLYPPFVGHVDGRDPKELLA